MAKISFEVISEKHGEGNVDVPDKTLKKGEDAVKAYLIDNGYIDNALEYATMTSLKVVYA